MKVSLNRDTLAYQFGIRPAVLCRDMSQMAMVPTTVAMHAFKGQSEDGLKKMMSPTTVIDYAVQGDPEIDALMFYMMNHAVSVLRQKKHPYESLGALLPVVEEYHNMLSIRAMRMFYYLLLICTRESRHVKDGYDATVWKNIVKKWGPEFKAFHPSISDSSSIIGTMKDAKIQMTVGNFTGALSDIFRFGKYNSSYGGPAWAKVADVLRDFVHGKLSSEMMLDTSFTLCHNNGPIFNKGMLFSGYTNHIYKILDVQRSGQIPQFVGNKETAHHSNPEIARVWKLCASVLPNEFSGYVDWFLVEELGALHGPYSTEKTAQTEKHGYPTKFKAKMEAEKAKKELAEKKAKEEEKMLVQLMPDLKVKKVEVVRS